MQVVIGQNNNANRHSDNEACLGTVRYSTVRAKTHCVLLHVLFIKFIYTLIVVVVTFNTNNVFFFNVKNDQVHTNSIESFRHIDNSLFDKIITLLCTMCMYMYMCVCVWMDEKATLLR